MYRFVDDVRMLQFPRVSEQSEKTAAGSDYVEITGEADVPFEIKRIFYIYGTKNRDTIRGKHANRRSEFVLMNISGNSKVRVIDEEGSATVYRLDRPNVGLYLPKMTWKEMYDFSPDSVLLVLSSERYDAEEYIRDFDGFVQEVCALQEDAVRA